MATTNASNFGIRSLAAFIVTAGCSLDSKVMNISVNTRTAEGRPVAEAIILLDGKAVGKTNAFGTFTFSKSFKSSTRHQVTITKEDRNYYYAPHIEPFVLNDKLSKDLNVDARMYLVPKPKSHLETASIPQGSKQLDPPTSDIDSPMSLPLLEIPEIFWPRISEEISPAKAPSDQRKILTIHTYHGRSTLAEVLIQLVRGGKSISSCISNERGRCVLHLTLPYDSTDSILLSKKGFQSELRPIGSDFKSNIRINLASGPSVDLKLTEVAYGLKMPAQEADVIINGTTRGRTDLNGIAIIPWSEQDIWEIKAVSKNFATPALIRLPLQGLGLIESSIPVDYPDRLVSLNLKELHTESSFESLRATTSGRRLGQPVLAQLESFLKGRSNEHTPALNRTELDVVPVLLSSSNHSPAIRIRLQGPEGLVWQSSEHILPNDISSKELEKISKELVKELAACTRDPRNVKCFESPNSLAVNPIAVLGDTQDDEIAIAKLAAENDWAAASKIIEALLSKDPKNLRNTMLAAKINNQMRDFSATSNNLLLVLKSNEVAQSNLAQLKTEFNLIQVKAARFELAINDAQAAEELRYLSERISQMRNQLAANARDDTYFKQALDGTKKFIEKLLAKADPQLNGNSKSNTASMPIQGPEETSL